MKIKPRIFCHRISLIPEKEFNFKKGITGTKKFTKQNTGRTLKKLFYNQKRIIARIISYTWYEVKECMKVSSNTNKKKINKLGASYNVKTNVLFQHTKCV